MKFKLRIYLVLTAVLAVFCFNELNAQSRTELEKNRAKTLKEIEYASRLLNETKNSKKSTISSLNLLERKIESRKNLISNLNVEVGLIDNEIESKEDLITTLEQEISRLRTEYEKLILIAHRNNTLYNEWVYILSAEDFNQAYRRVLFLNRISEYRRMQADSIIKLSDEINIEIIELDNKKSNKQKVLNKVYTESEKLSNEKYSKKEVLSNLKRKEKGLRERIKKSEEVTRKLQKEIEKIIAEEARKAAEASKSKGEFVLTPEEKIISDNFGKNKGRIPWPTERGVITGKYGEHPHPVVKGVMVKNNGIDIATNKGMLVRSVFEGEVSKIISIPGANKAVIIKHGDYYTLYSNLIDVMVQAGQMVTLKQNIGIVYSDETNNETILHFEIWKGTNKQNPNYWITK